MADVEFADLPEDETPPAGSRLLLVDPATTSDQFPDGTPFTAAIESIAPPFPADLADLAIADPSAERTRLGAAAIAHGHAIGDVSGLDDALNGKQPSGSYATASALSSHAADQANPHGVTKAQVGLPAVPNTDATQRANHTGSQLAATISDLSDTLAAYLASHLDEGSNVTISIDPTTKVITIAATGGGASLPATTSLLKGDGSGGAQAATGLSWGDAALTMPESFAIGGGSHGSTYQGDATYTGMIVIGHGASMSGTVPYRTVIVGREATVSGTFGHQSVVIGATSTMTNGYTNVLIGESSSMAGVNGCVLIGQGQTLTATGSAVIGVGNNVSGGNNIAVGGNNTLSHTYAMAFGTGVVSDADGMIGFATGGSPTDYRAMANSSTTVRSMTSVRSSWANNTDATRAGRLSLAAYDWAGRREGVQVEADGTQPLVGLYGVTPVARQSVAGTATGTDAALINDLIAKLKNTGIIS